MYSAFKWWEYLSRFIWGILFKGGGDARGPLQRRYLPGGLFLSYLYAPLDIANGIEILGELGAVTRTKPAHGANQMRRTSQ